MVNYAKKFGISKDILKSWQSEEIYLEGDKNTLIILVPGWSAVTRQMLPLAERINSFGYTVEVLKLSGHGTRPEDLEGVKWQDWVNDLEEKIRFYKKNRNFEKIFIGGVSMGGNICLLTSLREKVDGIVLIGTPVHLKGNLTIKISSIIMPLFRKYTKKKRPRNVFFEEKDSYQYFPVKNMREVLTIIGNSVKLLEKIKAPILILQTKNDFFVTKYSPWIIYKNVSSRIKKISWIHTESENHVPQKGEEMEKTAEIIKQFIQKVI